MFSEGVVEDRVTRLKTVLVWRMELLKTCNLCSKDYEMVSFFSITKPVDYVEEGSMELWGPVYWE